MDESETLLEMRRTLREQLARSCRRRRLSSSIKYIVNISKRRFNYLADPPINRGKVNNSQCLFTTRHWKASSVSRCKTIISMKTSQPDCVGAFTLQVGSINEINPFNRYWVGNTLKRTRLHAAGVALLKSLEYMPNKFD